MRRVFIPYAVSILALPVLAAVFLAAEPTRAGWHDPVIRLTVDVSPEQGGDIRVDTVIPPSYPFTLSHTAETELKLTAVPSHGYAFVEWAGDVNGDNKSIILSPTCDTTVTAIFAPAQSTFAWWWLAAGIGTISLILLVYFRLTRRTYAPAIPPDEQVQ